MAELRRRGHCVVEEPGRRVVKSELQSGGGALPWVDLAAFARRAIETSIDDRDAVSTSSGLVFFDRGLVDAAAALEHATGEPGLEWLRPLHRYNDTVFFTPPWHEIYMGDPERRHRFEDALAEYERLERIYPMLGYRVNVLPKVSVEARADLVLAALKAIPTP